MTALAETIAAQAERLAAVMTVELDEAVSQLEPARRVWLVGTGTSQHAAELGAWMFAGGDKEVHARSSAAFAYTDRPLRAEDAVVVISHTTETAFAQRARQRVLESPARLVTITGQGKDWPEAVQTVEAERSETYTVSYLAALVILARLSVALRQSSYNAAQLLELPDRVQAAATASTSWFESVPRRLLVLAGVGPGAVTAREGALKLREAARLAAEGYEAEYLLHGSAVPLRGGDGLIAVQPTHDRSGLLDGLLAAAAREGLSTSAVHEADGLDPVLSQIPLTVRLQTVAATLADARGVDPDRVIEASWADDRLWQAGAPAAGEI
ncbi:MAG: SIS domain-containing protein [Actinomycetota bacterium]|nr:SIS domain-containing protein [Actinomycetota bacterium]